MTQKSGEIAIGRVATDEDLRQALLGLDPPALQGFALPIDPGLQRAALLPPLTTPRRKRSKR